MLLPISCNFDMKYVICEMLVNFIHFIEKIFTIKCYFKYEQKVKVTREENEKK